MKSYLKKLLIFAFFSLLITALKAEGGEKSTNIGTIKVTAKREIKQEAIVEYPTSYVTVIDGKKIEKQFRSVPEAISDEVGVRVNKLGGLGSFSTISIRGSSSDQVVVLLDGIPINEARGGGVDISEIPLFNIDSIEIYRGNSPLRFGQSGIGGIVNIKTQIPENENTFKSSFSYGSFETYRYSYFVTHSFKKTKLLIGIDYSKSDNDFDFFDDNGTIFTSEDDRWTHRKNNRFRSLNILSRIEKEITSNFSISFYNNLTRTFKGVPGISAYQSEKASLRNLMNISRITFKANHFPHKMFTLKLTLYNTYEVSKFKDKLGEIGIGFQDNRNETNSIGARLNLEGTLFEYLDTNFLIEERYERFKPEDKLATSKSGNSYRRTLTLGTEENFNLLSNRLMLTAAVKSDMINDKSSDNSPFFFADKLRFKREYSEYTTYQTGFKFSPISWITVRGNVGKYYRIPSFFELFGDRGGVIGNPNLLAETGKNRDIGIRIEKIFTDNPFLKKFYLESVYFDNEVKNLILFIQNSQRTSKPENIGKARIKGAEFSLGLNLTDYIEASANYTKLDARDKSRIPAYKSKFLPGRPKKEFTYRVRIFNEYGEIYYNLTKIEKNFLDRANLKPTRDREIHNIGASIFFGKTFTINFEAKNLNDSNVSDVNGYPIPGQSFFITFTTFFEGR
ncbi:MAG: TonB-dependent receptor [Candidatus Schekmanbacteria bacterium]|nr:MAG: TonB-dependent receptor [Candidatus Schekmanbacteria bacterium]